MSEAKKQYQDLSRFVLENNVRERGPTLFDSKRGLYIVHESHVPNRHYETIGSRLQFDSGYFFAKKIGGFQPEVVK